MATDQNRLPKGYDTLFILLNQILITLKTL